MTNEEFERLAELLFRDTGNLAPGKDESPSYSQRPREERELMWRKCLASRGER